MDLKLKHDSRDINYRNPFGSICRVKKVYIAILLNEFLEVNLDLCYFDYSKKSIKMDNLKHNEEEYLYYCYIDLDENYEGLINYYFRIRTDNGNYIYYGNNSDGLGGEGQVYYETPVPYQITVYKPFNVPEWFKEGIVYQIFVDRFKNGNDDGRITNPKPNSFIYGNWNDEPMYIKDASGKIARWDFFGGNLKGVIEKLDYIKSLGVTAIYLNPIFKSASNHKYDTGDYRNIDEMYGDEDTFKELCQEANKINIKIILDGVFSHTADDSIYFNKYNNYNSVGAYQSKESPYYNWYKFRNYPDEYESWWGVSSMPNINDMDSTYLDFIVSGENSILKKWMEAGAYGWRLDVADELSDKFIEKIRDRIKSIYSDSVLIGEVWEDASNKISYSNRRKYVFGHELDSVTNYPFRNAVIGFLKGDIDSKFFERIILSLYENYPKEMFYSNLNVIGTHDTERILTVLGNNTEKALQLLKMAVAVQMTMPGVPTIYYGDEVGVLGGNDPLNRKTYPWGNENNSILDFYRYITKVRSRSDALKKGDIKFYSVDNDLLCYDRSFNNEKILIAINRNENRVFNVKINDRDIDVLPCEIKIINLE